MKITHLVSFIFLVVFLSSCSIEKRLYNKGFYVQKHKMHASQDILTEKALTANTIDEEEPVPVFSTDTLLQESITPNSTCDTVFLANGERVICTIDHTENEQLFILACEEEAIPKTSFEMKEVLSIHYANGDVEEIRKMTKEEQQQLEEKKITVEESEDAATKLHPLYFISLGLLIIAVVLFLLALELSIGFELYLIAFIVGILALVASIISLAFHGKARPKRYLGIGLSIANVILSAISIVVATFATFINLVF